MSGAFFVLVYRSASNKESAPADECERRCGALNQTDFTQLMQQYQKLVYTVCLQFVHNPHTAEDLTQDTFLSAWSSIDRCEPQYYKQWLVRVAANKCKDHLKSSWARRVEAQSDETMPEPRGTPPPGSGLQSAEPDPQDEFMRQTDAAELETMVRTLREPYGRAAAMYLLDGLPVAAIAQKLGRPAPTVQNQLFRAKAILRKDHGKEAGIMEQAMFPQNENNTPFDNEALFDAEGHLTDEGLHALQEGRLDELGSLETAEHLTFCDYCLARYTALIELAPEKLKQPMRDLIPQVQALMRLRSFRIMTNRYVSTAAAVMLAFALWRFGFFGGVGTVQKPVQQLPDVTPRVTVSQALGGMFDSMSSGFSDMFSGMQLAINSGLAQLADPVVPRSNPTKNGGSPAHGE